MSQIGFFGGGGGGGSGPVLTITGNVGVATPVAGNLNVVGGVGGNITTTGAGNTLTVVVSGTTNHAVQVGTNTGSLASIPVGLTGQVLTGVTGSDPVFASPAASSISITGNSGGALTGNAFTFTGGTTGLTFAGSGSTETLGGTLAIANGGTNATSMTNADGVVYFDGTRLVTTTVGIAGQILTSNGAGVAPTFQSGAGATIAITGDVGGTITSGSFTFTGGSTGLTFTGAGTTETLGGTVAIASGGTNATSFATTDGTVYFDGTRLVTTATGTLGQVLTSAGPGVAPSYQSPAASSISITGDSGGALTGNAFTFTGGTTGLTFAGSGSTETLGGTLVVSNGGTGAATLTANGVLLGNGTSAVTATAAGTTGQVLTGVTGSAPVFASPAASSISITGNSGGALTGNAFTFTGGTTGLTFAGAGSTETLGGTLVVSNGGTGLATLTAHSVLVGEGTSAITPLTVGTDGQVLTGNSAADPGFAAIGTKSGLTAHSVVLAQGAGAFTALGAATNGQLIIGSTGADPVLASLTAGTGITITPGAGSISIAASGASFTWSVITANQTAAVNNGYICNKAGTLSLLLPVSSAIGSIIEVTGINTALGWQITQGTGQQIFFGNTQTTVTTGTLTSTAIRDSIRIVCVVADTTWNVLSSVGNITVT